MPFWLRFGRSFLFTLLLSQCGFPQSRRNKHRKANKQTDKETKSRNQPEGIRPAQQDATTRPRVSRAVTPVNSRGPIIHINGGLVVNLGNTCAESEGSGAGKEDWHVQQLCGCRHGGDLWSSVLRCDRALADGAAVAGWGWGWVWTGPYGLRESVRKGTCSRAKNNKVKKHFPP